MTDIILINEQDEEIGTGEKLMVHQRGLLHRAFSILVFNSNNELLIHQRTSHKYHSGDLWTNTCCGHPNANEEISEAAHRRLGEEMGFDTSLEFLYKFQYRTDFANGLIENEIDHVFVGNYNESFIVNPEEVANFQWITVDDLLEQVALNPEKYTFWFKKILKSDEFLTYVASNTILV
ncbi:isopentenyl-diphosphate Delta-isomerase [Emticicia sp. SJ17W-69]|uniref:isopentenyl-diphosphate Delta-isomerase n=1 Tax=Emticicia sp. SJ17W-69 TaxID=3421657 RepID=UPI003EBBED25